MGQLSLEMRSLPEKPVKMNLRARVDQALTDLEDRLYEWAGNATALKTRRADPRAEAFDEGANEMAVKCAQEVRELRRELNPRVRDAMSRR